MLKLLILGLIFLSVGAGLAQSPPTASEAFNLRIKCKGMADAKAEALQWHPLSIADGALLGMSAANVEALNKSTMPNVVASSHSSKYDAKNNRCYVEIYQQTRNKPGNKPFEHQVRQVYDAQVDDLLAFANIENGKKHGMIFDPAVPRSLNAGEASWNEASKYIDEIMDDRRK